MPTSPCLSLATLLVTITICLSQKDALKQGDVGKPSLSVLNDYHDIGRQLQSAKPKALAAPAAGSTAESKTQRDEDSGAGIDSEEEEARAHAAYAFHVPQVDVTSTPTVKSPGKSATSTLKTVWRGIVSTGKAMSTFITRVYRRAVTSAQAYFDKHPIVYLVCFSLTLTMLTSSMILLARSIYLDVKQCRQARLERRMAMLTEQLLQEGDSEHTHAVKGEKSLSCDAGDAGESANVPELLLTEPGSKECACEFCEEVRDVKIQIR